MFKKILSMFGLRIQRDADLFDAGIIPYSDMPLYCLKDADIDYVWFCRKCLKYPVHMTSSYPPKCCACKKKLIPVVKT